MNPAEAPLDPRAAYLLTVSLALGLGAFALAAQLYRRFFVGTRGRVLDIYALLLILAVVLGITARGWHVLGRASLISLVVAPAAGMIVGEASRRADRLVLRSLSRRRGGSRRSAPPPKPTSSRPTPARGAVLLGGGARVEPGSPRTRTNVLRVDPREFPLTTVLVVAAAEELFYRGLLLREALAPGAWVAGLLVVATTTAFLLTHLSFGWSHVLSKAPLGVGTTVVVLLTGSVLSAVIAHAWFNLSVWRDLAPSRKAQR